MCHTFKGNAIKISKKRAEATDIVSAELLKELLWLFGHDLALDVYYIILDYAPCSKEGTKAEGSTA